MSHAILELLAERYPQLYVAPGPGAEQAYMEAVSCGEAPDERSLGHFIGSERDELCTESTPAGDAEILYLHERADFETFLRIIGCRCRPDPILPSVGAQTYLGLRNWKKIRGHREEYLQNGGDDWPSEIRRFAADKAKSTDILIVISGEPYSALPWDRTPYGEQEWLKISRDIRTYHECAHFFCRRTFPDRIHPLWDELTADLTGLRRATGSYDPALAAAFLGVNASGYTGGRLLHYLGEAERERPDEAAAELWRLIGELKAISDRWPVGRSYELLAELTENPLLAR